MVIDAHHRLWSLRAHDYSWLDEAFYASVRRDFALADLVPELAAAGVERTVLVEAGSGEPAETMEFLALADASAGLVAGVVGTIDLQSPRGSGGRGTAARASTVANRSLSAWGSRGSRRRASPSCLPERQAPLRQGSMAERTPRRCSMARRCRRA
jgi:predicted TIM-barrel fold metal-dependent hydrolase